MYGMKVKVVDLLLQFKLDDDDGWGDDSWRVRRIFLGTNFPYFSLFLYRTMSKSVSLHGNNFVFFGLGWSFFSSDGILWQLGIEVVEAEKDEVINATSFSASLHFPKKFKCSPSREWKLLSLTNSLLASKNKHLKSLQSLQSSWL